MLETRSPLPRPADAPHGVLTVTADDTPFAGHRLRNLLHSTLLIGGMFALFAAFGYVLAGIEGILWLGILGLVSATIGVRMAPRMILRMYRARPLSPAHAPSLHRMVERLAKRSGLEQAPSLYYVPSKMVNAFAVGTRDRAVVGITDGMLRTLGGRDVLNVLAHEITHLRHNDAWVMSLADFVTRTVNFMSWIGQLLLLLNLPFILTGQVIVPWSLILLLIFAPTLSAMLQLALSRAREFDADVGAARLTGDPRGMAEALSRMERIQGGFLERIFMPGRRVPDPSLLRTHPRTEDRVERLLEMEEEMERERMQVEGPVVDLQSTSPPRRPPRWHLLGGAWH